MPPKSSLITDLRGFKPPPVIDIRRFKLITLDITYRRPDSAGLVQTFLYQFEDIAPEFDRARHFLDYWRENIGGQLVRVQCAGRILFRADDLRTRATEFIVQ